MLLLLAACIGIYLGLHFNVLVLAPFCTLGAGAYLASSWAGHAPMASVTDLILPLTAVQMGYFLGLVSRDTLTGILAKFYPGRSTSSRRQS